MEFKNSRAVNPFYQHHSLTSLFQNFRKRKEKARKWAVKDITIFISQASSRMCEYLPSQLQLSLTRFSKWHSAAALERSELPAERAKQIMTCSPKTGVYDSKIFTLIILFQSFCPSIYCYSPLCCLWIKLIT